MHTFDHKYYYPQDANLGYAIQMEVKENDLPGNRPIEEQIQRLSEIVGDLAETLLRHGRLTEDEAVTILGSHLWTTHKDS